MSTSPSRLHERPKSTTTTPVNVVHPADVSRWQDTYLKLNAKVLAERVWDRDHSHLVHISRTKCPENNISPNTSDTPYFTKGVETLARHRMKNLQEYTKELDSTDWIFQKY